MDETLEQQLPPQRDEPAEDEEQLELLAEELREAIRRKLPLPEAPT